MWCRWSIMMNELERLKIRLHKIGIDISMVSNFPWVYLYKINDKVVKDKFKSNYGFTIAFLSLVEEEPKLTDLNKIFETIRKYI